MGERKRAEQRVRSALGALEAPDELAAEERARRVVTAVFAGHEPLTPRARGPIRAAVALLAVAALAGLALTPAGAEVRQWIAETIESSGEEDAAPRLTSLPAAGSVLVEATSGAWTIGADGSKRRLGDFDEAAWSPNARFVAVSDGEELRAIDPVGTFRWSIEAGARIKAIDWSPDEGFRVAYLAGRELGVVTGDGATDALIGLARAVAPVWQPEADSDTALHRLTFVDPRNRVVSQETDAGRMLWRTQRFSADVRKLEWSADGERLLVVAGDFVTILDGRGRSIVKGPSATGVEHAAISPSGHEVAVVVTGERGTELKLTGTDGSGERLYAGGRQSPDARFGAPVFSPDGDWILLPWPEADQWLFINTHDKRVIAVADIARQFGAGGKDSGAFPDVAGWCC